MRPRHLSHRPGLHVVCLVVLIVVARSTHRLSAPGRDRGWPLPHTFLLGRPTCPRPPHVMAARLPRVGLEVTHCSTTIERLLGAKPYRSPGQVSNTNPGPAEVACAASAFTGVLHPRE